MKHLRDILVVIFATIVALLVAFVPEYVTYRWFAPDWFIEKVFTLLVLGIEACLFIPAAIMAWVGIVAGLTEY